MHAPKRIPTLNIPPPHSSPGKLVSRFYDPKKGTILIDGQDLTNVDVNSLRSQIGIVSQEPLLFDTTIRTNISYGVADYENVTDEAIMAVSTPSIHFPHQRSKGQFCQNSSIVSSVFLIYLSMFKIPLLACRSTFIYALSTPHYNPGNATGRQSRQCPFLHFFETVSPRLQHIRRVQRW